MKSVRFVIATIWSLDVVYTLITERIGKINALCIIAGAIFIGITSMYELAKGKEALRSGRGKKRNH